MVFKRNYFFVFVFMIFMCVPSFARGKDRYISVNEIEAKSSPSFWGSSSATFVYGDKVQVLTEKNGWVKVSKSGKSGWVKKSCVTSRKIRAEGRVSVDADEIALAGKGFSNSLEAEYSDSYNVDFSDVDFIESMKLSNNSLREFIVDGDLMGAN